MGVHGKVACLVGEVPQLSPKTMMELIYAILE
jgi:hypothetical protein